jgi:ComF family protein
MNSFFDKLSDLLFPPRCPFCRAILGDHEKTLCANCRSALPWTPQAAQKQRFRHVDACVSPLYYEGNVRSSLLRYKFGALPVYAPKYARLMLACIRTNELDFDLISWVPLSKKRLRKRGYDQAKLLAQELAAELGKPCEKLLEKTADNPPQSETGSAEKRKANVSGVYKLIDSGPVRDRRVLLVDDIVTTGATLGECAGILKAAGAASVCAATLARSKRD